MEITGRIIAALPVKEGVSTRTGNNWKSQEFVIETHDQYPRKCVFSVFGEDKISQMNIQIGDELTVSFDVDAHEWNGRWFNSIRAWRVERVQAQQPDNMATTNMMPGGMPAPNLPAAGPTDFSSSDPVDDLPF